LQVGCSPAIVGRAPDDKNVTWLARRLGSNWINETAEAIRMTNAIPLKWARLQAAVLSAAMAGIAAAQDNGAPPPQSARGEHPDGPHGQQTLTQDQTARVTAILKAYKPAGVTAEDARAIHRAFRDAGIRPGPGLHDAIKAAGFDPDRLRALDPPPPRPPRDEPGQGPGAPRP
jgi:hypothetical protein